jgi:hypothetical protein
VAKKVIFDFAPPSPPPSFPASPLLPLDDPPLDEVAPLDDVSPDEDVAPEEEEVPLSAASVTGVASSLLPQACARQKPVTTLSDARP